MMNGNANFDILTNSFTIQQTFLLSFLQKQRKKASVGVSINDVEKC